MGAGDGMKTSERLFARVEGLWREALEKPFVTEMADGSLCAERFRYYMRQDALYIGDYIGILELIRRKVEEREPSRREDEPGAGGPGFVRGGAKGFDGDLTGASLVCGRDGARPSQAVGEKRGFEVGRDWKSHLPGAGPFLPGDDAGGFDGGLTGTSLVCGRDGARPSQAVGGDGGFVVGRDWKSHLPGVRPSQDGNSDLGEFLDGIIAATKEELERVHRVNLEKLEGGARDSREPKDSREPREPRKMPSMWRI